MNTYSITHDNEVLEVLGNLCTSYHILKGSLDDEQRCLFEDIMNELSTYIRSEDDDSYQRGYDEAFDELRAYDNDTEAEAHDEGFKEGYEKGYKRGYEAGYNSARATHDSSYHY